MLSLVPQALISAQPLFNAMLGAVLCLALIARVESLLAPSGCERAQSLVAPPPPAQPQRGGLRPLHLRGRAAARMAAEVTLYTNKMCPFAQKAWIALEEKKAAHGVPFKSEEINLYGAGGKPGWFLKVLDWIDNAIHFCTHARLRPPDSRLTAASRPQMNPKGEVPVLKHGDKVVVESDNIILYIDQALGTPAELSQVRTFAHALGTHVRHGALRPRANPARAR